MALVGEALVLLAVLRRVLAVLRVLGGVWRVLLRVLAVGRVLRRVRAVLGVRSVLRVLLVLVLCVLAVRSMLVVLGVGEVLRVRGAVARVRLGGVRQGHLATAARVVVGMAVGQAVLSANGATGGVLIGAGRVCLLGGIRLHAHQTLLAKGLLKDRLVKAAEGGTEIFKVREQKLLVPLWHVVLGLGGLLEVHGLRHWFWETSHRCVAVHAAHTVEIDRGQTLVRQAVVKAASRTVTPFLVCVVQRHLVSHSVDCQCWRGTSRDHTLHP